VSRIPIYQAERPLADQIRGSCSVAYASLAETAEPFALAELVKAHLQAHATNLGQTDLHYLKTLMVSTGWNKNDDVFDPVEVWNARATPEDKPFNYEHNPADIIGHITDNYVVGLDSKAIANDSTIDSLPDAFHILTNAVLYKYWGDNKELNERMAKVIAEIADNKWFVSMEALFTNFDYATVDGKGIAKTVARNKETAFLTKHLRAYGGKGVYQDMKVGRVLRNITFSGKGLVRKPANPESIIFSVAAQPPVYANVSEENEDIMSEKIIAELRQEIDGLKTSLSDSDAKKLAVEATVKELQDAKTKVEALLTESASALKVSATEVESLKKSLSDTQGELTSLRAEQTLLKRVSAYASKLSVSDAEAKTLVAALVSLSDEQFDAHLSGLVTAKEKWMTRPQDGNTPFPAPKPQDPPKATTLPTAPQVTTLPAPMAKGSDAVDQPIVLDQLKPDNSPALVVNSARAGVEKVRTDIASYFGVKVEE
jgi:hypothetical protein